MRRAQSRRVLMVAALFLLAGQTFPTMVPAVVASKTYALSSAYNSERKIAADPAGNLFTAYTAEAANGSYYVRVAESTDAGASWHVLPGCPAVANSSRSAIAADAKGRIDIVWTEGVPARSQIYFSSYFEGNWSAKVLLSNTKWYSGFPSMAIDSKGRVHVVWYGFDGLYYQIYYAEWNGSAWATPVNLSRQREDSLNPTIAVDSNGDLHVAWYGEVSHYYQIWYAAYDDSRSKPVPVTGTQADSTNPSISTGPNGQVDVVWTKDQNGTLQVYHMSSLGGAWGPKVQLTNGSLASENPTQVFSQNGSLYVFWTSGGAIFMCEYKGSCRPQVIYSVGYNTFPGAAWAGIRGIALVWSHQISAGDTTGNSVLFTLLSHPRGFPTWAAGLLTAAIALIVVVSLWTVVRRSLRASAAS